MIGARVLANDEDRVGLVEVFQLHAALADPESFVHRGAARFVTHVRAIRQIICAELASEELIKKGGFITRPPAGIKCGGIRGCQRIQLRCDQLKGRIPGDRLVVSRAFTLQQWFRESTLAA